MRQAHAIAAVLLWVLVSGLAGVAAESESLSATSLDESVKRYLELSEARGKALELSIEELLKAMDCFDAGSFSSADTYVRRSRAAQIVVVEIDGELIKELARMVVALDAKTPSLRQRAAAHLLTIAKKAEEPWQWSGMKQVETALRDRAKQESDPSARSAQMEAADYIKKHYPKSEKEAKDSQSSSSKSPTKTAPSPIEKETAPSPIEKETAPSPVGKETAPSPVGKETAASPVGKETEVAQGPGGAGSAAAPDAAPAAPVYGSPQQGKELREAAKNADLVSVQRLLASGVSPDLREKDRWRPLMYAVDPPDDDSRKAGLAVVRALLEAGADVNGRASSGRTALHSAVDSDHADAEIVKLLLAAGAEVNPRGLVAFTPLHRAATEDSTEIVALLLDHGASIDAQSNDGRTPLHLAAAFGGRRAITELLIARGASLEAKDGGGRTPLHTAAHERQFGMAEALVTAGADVGAKDSKGWTPLHEAANVDDPSVALLLVNNKADVNATNQRGFTPLYYAKQNSQLADLLQRHGGH